MAFRKRHLTDHLVLEIPRNFITYPSELSETYVVAKWKFQGETILVSGVALNYILNYREITAKAISRND